MFIRDPLWNNIRVEAFALRLVDTPAFQRLRYVRQLGLAHLVYPGATHSRFEHALGTYHLARTALGVLSERGELNRVPAEEANLVRAAALLHDIGHYPFSHALEEIGIPHHEEVARPLIAEGDVGAILRSEFGADAPQRVLAMIRGESTSPLAGLISGSVDLDKIEYLKRDALMCGVPYGEIDVDRLMHALVVLDDPVTRRARIGINDKGLSALESLLFAKYQMYRNVYWHHAVRSATAMYKRLVEDALANGTVQHTKLIGFTDEGLLAELRGAGSSSLLEALQRRTLWKRAAERSAEDLEDRDLEWIATDRPRARALENDLARRHGLAPGDVLVDYPTKTQMLGLELPVRLRDESVVALTTKGLPGAVNLPKLSDEFYRSARWLRVFAKERIDVDLGDVLKA
ncbi:MAG TPA: HD domain-containing protein [Gemmatimonadaceae bacterium]|nr:HD domain-containing protein [Gemmatimonadaceae bacterium]